MADHWSTIRRQAAMRLDTLRWRPSYDYRRTLAARREHRHRDRGCAGLPDRAREAPTVAGAGALGGGAVDLQLPARPGHPVLCHAGAHRAVLWRAMAALAAAAHGGAGAVWRKLRPLPLGAGFIQRPGKWRRKGLLPRPADTSLQALPA